MLQGNVLRVDQLGRKRILGHRPDREDANKLTTAVCRRPNPVDDIERKLKVKLRGIIDYPNLKVRIRVVLDLLSCDCPDSLTSVKIPKGNELRQIVAEPHGCPSSLVLQQPLLA